MSEPTVTKVFMLPNSLPLRSHSIPLLETADVDMDDNYWPPRPQPTRFELFKSGARTPQQRWR